MHPSRLTVFANEWLLHYKFAYFSMSLAMYSTYVYTPNYLDEVWNIPVHSYGYISSICVLSLSGSVLWCRVAEKCSCFRLVLLGCTLLYALLFALLWTEVGAKSSSTALKVVIVTALYGGSSAFGSAMAPLLDQIVLRSLGGEGRNLFGRQKLWSSVGHAVVVVANGWGIQNYGYLAMFLSLLIATALCLTAILLLAENTPPEPDGSSTPKEDGGLFGLTTAWDMLWRGPVLIFMLSVLVAGYVRCVVGSFAPVYFKRILKMKDVAYGLAMQARLIPELLFFFVGSDIGSLLGDQWIMAAGQAAGILRSAIYGLVSEGDGLSWVTYPAEMLKGINNAGIMMAGPRMAYRLAPSGTETTILSLFHGVYGSLAMILAGVAGGQILQTLGPTAKGFRMLFLSTAIGGMLPLAAIASLQSRFRST